MNRILNDMLYSLEQGQQLSAVFEKYPTVFEPFFLTLVRAGEVSGKLAEVFKYLESELRSEYNLMSKIKGALLYPAVVFSAMIGIGILMFFFVLPQIGKVFLNLKIPLPVFTKTLFTVSIWLSHQLIPIMISAIVAIVLVIYALRQKKIRQLIFRISETIPLVKNLVRKIDLARFNRIFSTLIRSAVPITEALEISLESLTWHGYRNLSKTITDEIRKGKSLSEVLKSYKSFPPLMTQMVTAGEKTGQLDSSLGDLASFYEQEVEEELKNLTQILEPVLMLLVGIAVGVMILSIIAPIYSVVGNFQQAAGGPSAVQPPPPGAP
jgi:type II secretory pathway component PulF